MKRFIFLLFLMVTSMSLIACNKRDSGSNQAFDHVFTEELIQYTDHDSQEHVTQNIQLKLSSNKVDGVTIAWVSDHPEIIRIEGEQGIVTRPSEDTLVTLTATITIDGESKIKVYTLNVIGKSDTTPTPSSAFTIRGTKNWELFLGSSLPNFLDGVTAKDLNGKNVDVSIYENTVDIHTVGQYIVVYEAFDQDHQRTTKTVIVHVKPKPLATEYVTETFDNVPNTGSSYRDETFVGENGIQWTFKGSRTDEQLNGKAITFGGSNTDDQSTLYATIEGGIQSFSVDLKVAFGGNNKDRTIELFINGETYGIFTLDNTNTGIQTFKVHDIHVEGTFTLELRHVGKQNSKREQITIDNLSWLPFYGDTGSTGSLDQALTDLKIPMEYVKEGSIHLPKITEDGYSVTWEYLDEDDPNNEYIDLSNQRVTLPTSGRHIVKLVATVTKGEDSGQKVFTVVVGEPEIIPIVVVKDEHIGTIVHTEGIVTDYYVTDDHIKFFLQDETSGIFVIAPLSDRDIITVGHRIRLVGTKVMVSNQHAISDVTDITFIQVEERVPAKPVNNRQDLFDHAGQFVELNGLLRQVHPFYTDDFWIVNEYGEFKLVIPDDLPDDLKTAIRNLLADKQAGLEVTVQAGVMGEGSGVFLYLLNVENITLDTTINDKRVTSIILSNFEEPQFPNEVTGDLALPISDDLLFDAVIEWTSNHPNVISLEGKVNRPLDKDITVRFGYIITLDGTTIVEKYFELYVPKRPNFNEYYQSLEGLTGNAFISELNRIISKMNSLNYDDAKTVLPISDADPNNPENIILVYNRDSVKEKWDPDKVWNREHVWPQSKLAGAPKWDLHNLKPSNPHINSTRENHRFVDGSGTHGLVSGGYFPGEEDKGDIARILFYMVTRYDQLSIGTMGDLATLIKWHEEDPVDDFERNRNEVIYSYQGNRNPFIDHEEFVYIVFGLSPKVTSLTQTNDEPIFIQWIIDPIVLDDRRKVA